MKVIILIILFVSFSKTDVFCSSFRGLYIGSSLRQDRLSYRNFVTNTNINVDGSASIILNQNGAATINGTTYYAPGSIDVTTNTSINGINSSSGANFRSKYARGIDINVGYMHEFMDNFYGGLEINTTIFGSKTHVFDNGILGVGRYKPQSDIRLRFGYQYDEYGYSPSLFYVMFGLEFAKIGNGSHSVNMESEKGTMYGIGYETYLFDNISARAEYYITQFDHMSNAGFNIIDSSSTSKTIQFADNTAAFKLSTLRLGLVYHFTSEY